MSENKFTPGAWTFHDFEDFISIREQNGDEICYIDDFHENREEDVANARLMSEAPNMLKLLDRIHDYLEKLEFDDYKRQGENVIWINRIKKEMRKARG